MAPARRGPQPDPWAASDQAEFRALLRALQQWAGYSSLERLEEGAARRGTSMPPSTANRALNNDKLPTAEFVRRFVVACDVDVAPWTSARDALHDLKYSRDTTTNGPVENSTPDVRELPDLCPYPGLAAFRPDQAKWFFGREEVTAELLGLLTERMARTGPLVVVGPSGTGKSSLLRAGLLAALSAGRLPGSRDFAQLVFTPTADPLGALGTQLAAATGCGEKEIVAALPNDPQRVVAVIGKLSGAGEPHSSRAVIVVDQFEEVFTLCPDEHHRQAFIRVLCAAAAEGGALVVLGLRADHYGRCAAYPELIKALRVGHVLLGAMTNAQLRSAIEKPALAAGLELEPGLAEVMLRDLGQGNAAVGEPGCQPGALPLLSHALLATWQQREGRTLTLAGYRLVGGISGAVTKTAERVYRTLEPGQQETARSVLLRMIQLGDGADDTRRQVQCARLVAESTDPAGVEKILNALAEARLVTMDETTVTIVHEILLRAWPRLRQWIDADREGLLQQQRLAEAAQEWDRDGRHDSDLYRGHRLAALKERLDATDPHLAVLTSEFLRASVDQERSDELGVLRRGRLRKLVAVLGVGVLTAAMFAVQSRNNALRLEEAAVSSQVSGTAMQLRTSDRALAAQLAVAAYRLSDTPEARGAVLSTLVNLDLPRRTNVDSQTPVGTVTFNSNGRLLLAASRETSIWKLGDQPSLAEPPIALPHLQQVRSAAFSPNDQLLATSSKDNVVRLWDVEDAVRGDVVRGTAQPEPIAVMSAPAGPVAFRRDNNVLVTVGPTPETIQLWDLTADQPRSAGTILAHEPEVLTIAISRDGRYLASTGSDGTAKLWDITEPSAPKFVSVVAQDGGYVYAVAFNPDGSILATANKDNTARLFDIRNPKTPRAGSILDGHLGPVSGVAFSPDGETLVTTSHDTTARLWNISDADHPTLLAAPLAAYNEKVKSPAFSPDSHILAMTGEAHDVNLWETDVDLAITEICQTVTSPISPGQWNRYFPGRGYEPPCPARADSELRDATVLPAGSTSLVASNSGKCIAVKDDGALSGAPAHQVDCTDALGEKWTLRDVPATAPGNTEDRIVKIVSAISGGMCLESAEAERKFGGATHIVQRKCVDGNGAQLWILDVMKRRADSVDVRFRGHRNRECLNINGEAVENGAYVVRYRCHEPVPHDNEIFTIRPDAVGR